MGEGGVRVDGWVDGWMDGIDWRVVGFAGVMFWDSIGGFEGLGLRVWMGMGLRVWMGMGTDVWVWGLTCGCGDRYMGVG